MLTNFEVSEVDDPDQTFLKSLPKISILKSKANERTSDESSFHFTKSNNKGKLHIIQGHGKNSKHYELIDILSMQSIPEFNGATYLAASNFNCLEFQVVHKQQNMELQAIMGILHKDHIPLLLVDHQLSLEITL